MLYGGYLRVIYRVWGLGFGVYDPMYGYCKREWQLLFRVLGLWVS